MASRRLGWKLSVALLGWAVALSIAGAGLGGSSTAYRGGFALSTSSMAASPAVQTTCNLSSLSPLAFDTDFPPDSLDPAVSFSVPGWGAVQQVYQTLVQYNASSPTEFVGVLASSWIVTPDLLSFTFHLRAGIRFSNGDPVSAYTMWFSLYRALATNSSSQFILSQNFWYPGITYYSPANAQASAYASMVNALNTWNFVNPTAPQLSFMEGTSQSFQVIDATTIALHVGAGYLGQPYAYLLATLASPIASAVDPSVVQAHGGVGGYYNAWMSSNMMGTGPYVLTALNPSTGYTLTPDMSYWGRAAAAREPANAALQPARSSIQIRIQSSLLTQLADLQSGAAVGISSLLLTPPLVNLLRGDPCAVVKALDPIYGSTIGSWWVYMNQNVTPFNNLSVRRAVAHAINYGQILSVAFGGYAHPWVGPVPLGYPGSNPQNLAPYAYNLGLAQSYMNESPWPLPSGYPSALNFEYPNMGDWSVVATLLANDLAKIGITIRPVPITLNDLYALQSTNPSTGQCISDTSYAGGPFYIGLEFYTSDYLAPDDWTQTDALSSGSANMCMAHYANATVDSLVLSAAAQADPTTAAQDYATLTRILYDNVTDAWLAVPDQFQVHHPSLRGIVPNPMGSAPESTLTMNTMYAVPPLHVVASVSPTPATAGDTATFGSNVTGGTPPYSVVWQMGDGTNVTSTGAPFTHVYTIAGNYTANVTVRDSYGGYATGSVRVTVVAAAPPSPPPPTFAAWVVYATIAGAIVGVLAVVLLYVLLRRRSHRGPPPPAPPPVPPPPSGPGPGTP